MLRWPCTIRDAIRSIPPTRERLLLAEAWALSRRRFRPKPCEHQGTSVARNPLFATQHTRFELARWAISTRTSCTFIDECVRNALAGILDIALASMTKAHASEVQGDVLDCCPQLFGDYGPLLDRRRSPACMPTPAPSAATVVLTKS